jgi:hypothetical protein
VRPRWIDDGATPRLCTRRVSQRVSQALAFHAPRTASCCCDPPPAAAAQLFFLCGGPPSLLVGKVRLVSKQQTALYTFLTTLHPLTCSVCGTYLARRTHPTSLQDAETRFLSQPGRGQLRAHLHQHAQPVEVSSCLMPRYRMEILHLPVQNLDLRWQTGAASRSRRRPARSPALSLCRPLSCRPATFSACPVLVFCCLASSYRSPSCPVRFTGTGDVELQ